MRVAETWRLEKDMALILILFTKSAKFLQKLSNLIRKIKWILIDYNGLFWQQKSITLQKTMDYKRSQAVIFF